MTASFSFLPFIARRILVKQCSNIYSSSSLLEKIEGTIARRIIVKNLDLPALGEGAR
jgi:hypothetical protein